MAPPSCNYLGCCGLNLSSHLTLVPVTQIQMMKPLYQRTAYSSDITFKVVTQPASGHPQIHITLYICLHSSVANMVWKGNDVLYTWQPLHTKSRSGRVVRKYMGKKGQIRVFLGVFILNFIVQFIMIYFQDMELGSKALPLRNYSIKKNKQKSTQ